MFEKSIMNPAIIGVKGINTAAVMNLTKAFCGSRIILSATPTPIAINAKTKNIPDKLAHKVQPSFTNPISIYLLVTKDGLETSTKKFPDTIVKA